MLVDMKGKSVIEESGSLWSSPVLLARKKNGIFRFYVDYRTEKCHETELLCAPTD